jgi:hypothetical protein
LSVMNFDHRLESVYTSGPKKSSCSSKVSIMAHETKVSKVLGAGIS